MRDDQDGRESDEPDPERNSTESGEFTIDEYVDSVRSVTPAELPDVLRTVSRVTRADDERAERIVRRMEPLLENESENTRIAAMRTISTLASIHPGPVSTAVDSISRGFDDESAAVRAAAVRTFVSLADRKPEAVLPHLEAIEPLLADDVLYVGEAAFGVVEPLLPDHVESILSMRETLVEALESPPLLDPADRRRWMEQHPTYRETLDRELSTASDRERFLSSASKAVALVTTRRLSAFHGLVPAIATVLSREASTPVRRNLLDAIGAIAEDDPAAATPAIDSVVEVLVETHSDELKSKAAWTLAWIAEGAQQEVVSSISERTPSLFPSLEVSDDDLRGGVIVLLSHVAELDPESIEPAVPQIRSLLEDDSRLIRGAAVWTLAYAGTDEDLQRIRALAAEDPDPDVRDAASEVARYVTNHHNT